MERTHYDREEERRIAERLRAGEPAICPRCDVLLQRVAVPPKPDVPYVRDRVWLTCGACHRSVVLDRRRIEAPSDG